MGCYPIFACRDWSHLESDLAAVEDGLVSVSMVADPFGNYDQELLERCFPDRLVAFKQHFVADLSRGAAQIVSKHHRYYAQRAAAQVQVEQCSRPEEFLDEWIALYDNLISRHQLTGIKAFSRKAFAEQLQLPGMVMLRAAHEGQTVGAHLWFLEGEVGQSHLAAVSERGYELMASYAIYWFALETFAKQVRWLNFGAGAGLGSDSSDGLSRFKSGWSTEKRTAWFCGRIFNHERYAEIANAKGVAETRYFPAYRQGEFG